jgi:pimeloyl-ACP methyl ester carboxylesterase
MEEPLCGLAFFRTKPVQVGYVPIEDYQINYEIHGNGKERIVFLTGFMSSTGVWNELVEYFSMGPYSCMVVNNRGFSRSTTGSVSRYKTSNMAQDVIQVLICCGWNKEKSINLVGVSMGGMISQEIASARPDLIKSLTLLATTAKLALPTIGHKLMPIRLFFPRLNRKKKIDILIDTLFSDEWLNAADLRSQENITNREVVYNSILKQQFHDGKASWKTFMGQLGAVLTHNMSTDRLSKIGSEIKHVVCITGTGDKMIHHSATPFLALNIGCSYIMLDRKGHGLPKEAVPEIIQSMEELFDKANSVADERDDFGLNTLS